MPPLAWAMISGLMASTVLTLLVVPALYKLLFSRPSLGEMGMNRRSLAMAGVTVLVVFSSLLLADRAGAEESVTLAEAMTRAAERPRAEAAALRARSAELEARATKRAALWPSGGAAADLVRRDRDYDFETPLGSFTLGQRTSTSLAFQLTQPVFDPVRLLYAAPSAPGPPGRYISFSVDEFAAGLPGAPAPLNVTTEGSVGATAASADVFYALAQGAAGYAGIGRRSLPYAGIGRRSLPYAGIGRRSPGAWLTAPRSPFRPGTAKVPWTNPGIAAPGSGSESSGPG